MKRYLLDTNIVSEIARNNAPELQSRFEEAANDKMGINLIIRAELLYGINKNPGFKYRGRLLEIMNSLEVFELEAPVDVKYAEIRLALSNPGRQIGPNDLWIAAHAVALDAILVTANEREFSRVPGLKMENWLKMPDV
jgi:tRNA(fMet)-specific endonuclease VapC